MNLRKLAAEALGTFAIVFFGCGSIITQPGQAVAINAVFGLVVAAMIYALGPISGAHFNPAVTVAFGIRREISVRAGLDYVLAQIVGAIAASAIHSVILVDAEKSSFGATIPTLGLGQAFGLETLLTFFLVTVILSVATDIRVHRAVPGLAIGMTVAMSGLFSGPLTGNSLNPARSIGPALFANGPAMQALPVYLTAPVLGAILATYFQKWITAD